MEITGTNAMAEQNGIHVGTVLAAARDFVYDVVVEDDKPELPVKLLNVLPNGVSVSAPLLPPTCPTDC